MIATAALGGVALAILGPFGSYTNGGPVQLLAYWVGAMLLGVALYGSAFAIVSASTVPAPRWWWPALIAATLIASVPEAAATRAAAFRLWPGLDRLDLPPVLWFGQTAMIGLIAMVGVAIMRRRSAAPMVDEPARPSAEAAGTTLPGDVLALQMEDHYVRVHRRCGSELLLMPLGRAIEATPADGLRTHRSWWVASHAVAAVEGDARSMRVRLSNGVVAPVARSAVVRIRAAGWLGKAENDAAAS